MTEERESPLRSLMAEARGEDYRAFDTLDQARSHPEAAVVMEGDDGGTIYLTVPVARVACTEEALRQLAADIDFLCWNDPSMLHVIFERLPIGSGVAGGMGGGCVIDGIWLHPKLEALGIRGEAEAVISVLRHRITFPSKKW